MRITPEAKQATRERILATAQKLFRRNGFEQTTTRDMAREAGIASGTLFNYFPTKEAIVLTLVSAALQRGLDDFEKQPAGTEPSLEEELFAHVASGLRRMKPYRTFLGPVLETTLTPLARGAGNQLGETIRVDHLETVQGLIGERGLAETFSTVGVQLYWTLYTGVLAFWANDNSPQQEDTLALLDQSVRMFVRWLGRDRSNCR